ncbi:MAG: flagellar motor switch protein FliM [Planctomycetes bacterium]|nr:flagellar motor switch protein FliM [Planctomycetota bacterium]
MSEDILSQSEVENLLNSMEATGAARSLTPGKRKEDLGVTAGGVRVTGKITAYDFKRPERVGKEQMRALQSVHEGFSRNFGAALSAMLRCIVELKLTSVDQLTYGEFVYSLENPTCFNLIRAEPLDGHLILDINPTILFPIIDRLLGGGKEQGTPTRRPLTEIELRLVSRITSLFLKEMKGAWDNVLPIEPVVDRVESNAQLVQIVPPNEVVVLISFELTVGEVRGMLNLCIPFNSIERVSNKLQSNSWATYGGRQSSPDNRDRVRERLDASIVEVRAMLARTKITMKDLIELRVGDIITTEQDVKSPLTVAIQNVPKFHASPGALKGKKAIQILAPIDPPKPAAKAKPEPAKK